MIGPQQRTILTSVRRNAVLLATIALFCAAVVALTNELTAQRIASNEAAARLRTINALLPPARYDNALLRDTVQVRDAVLLGSDKPVTVYRARLQGQPVAVVLSGVAPAGYSGDIVLLVAINADGTLAGVRVTKHRETPGLGDAIDAYRSDWIRSFDGRSLQSPSSSGWRVRKDGGEFDQFTGATITPRAVVDAVHKVLLFYANNERRLFASGELSGE